MTTQTTDALTKAEDEAVRLMQLLARLVRLSGKSTRTIGAAVGLGSSMICKILNCDTRPLTGYLLAIAAVIGLSPQEFFTLAYPAKKEKATHPLAQNPAELERMVEAAVRRSLLQGLGSESGEPKS